MQQLSLLSPQALTRSGRSPKLSETETLRPQAYADMEIFLETTKSVDAIVYE